MKNSTDYIFYGTFCLVVHAPKSHGSSAENIEIIGTQFNFYLKLKKPKMATFYFDFL